MQSNKMNILMISYGRGALYENKEEFLIGIKSMQIILNSLKILYLTKKKFENKTWGIKN